MTKEARIYNGENTVSSAVVLGNLDNGMYINEIRTNPHITHKINSTWLKDLNIGFDTAKL